jgi:hypothetical protein
MSTAVLVLSQLHDARSYFCCLTAWFVTCADKRILDSLMIAAHGYVAPLHALSARDLVQPCE